MAYDLIIRELRAGYGGGEVLRGVTMTARAGEVTALLGLNGSGKTTLLRAAAGLLPARGRVLLGEDDERAGFFQQRYEELLTRAGTLAERMDAYEGQIIRDAYQRCGTTVAVAKELGISQATAARKVAKYVSKA